MINLELEELEIDDDRSLAVIYPPCGFFYFVNFCRVVDIFMINDDNVLIDADETDARLHVYNKLTVDDMIYLVDQMHLIYSKLDDAERAMCDKIRAVIDKTQAGADAAETDDVIGKIKSGFVLFEWGSDATMLETDEDKEQLIDYVSKYGCKTHTRLETEEDRWHELTSRLGLNYNYPGVIYTTTKYNSENMSFCFLDNDKQ